MKLHKAKLALLLINIVGGISVLGSYVYGFLTNPGSTSTLWGKVPAFLLPFYTASMFAAAAGYLAFTFFILVRLDPDETRMAGRFSYRVFLWLYAAILAPSALWMPLTFAILAAPSPVLWVVIRIVLAIVGLASAALLIALLGIRPGRRHLQYWLAVAGSILFLIQTAILDAVVWPAFFPLGF
jgi:hypothetical protein